MLKTRNQITVVVVAALLVTAALVGSHWYAYVKGKARVRIRNSAFGAIGMIPTAVEFLELAQTEDAELRSKTHDWWKRLLRISVKDVESCALPALRQEGNHEMVAEMERLVKDGQSLLEESANNKRR